MSNMADYLNLIANAEAIRVKQGLHKAAGLSIFALMSAAQVTDVLARTSTVDVSTVINSALATGLSFRYPEGVYRLENRLNPPKDKYLGIIGEGFQTEFRATMAMDYILYRDGLDVSGATLEATTIRDVFFNCNRLATYGPRIGAGKAGRFTNIKVKGWTGNGGFILGDASGTATARAYECSIYHLILDGDINYWPADPVATAPVNAPTGGLVMYNTATDTPITNLVASYINGAGAEVNGGSCLFFGPHSYATVYNVVANAPCRISEPHCDGQLIAGIKVNSQNVSITGGLYYWGASNQPATWTPGVAPVYGQGVPVQIEAGIDQFSWVGGSIRGHNGLNPALRWLGTSKPQRMTVFGQTPPLRMAGDLAVSGTERSFQVFRTPGNPSEISIDTSTGQVGVYKWYVNGKLRATLGTDGTTETGTGNAGNNLDLKTLADDGSTVLSTTKIFRATGQIVGANQIQASTSLRSGSYTVATLPSGAGQGAGSIIYVSDGASGQPCEAFWNGTSWLRLTAGVAVSAT